MGVALSLALPLAAMSMASGDQPGPDAGSARFANVLVTAYVCEHLGFGVDYVGLADWGDAITDDLIAAGTAPEGALAHIRRDVVTARGAFHRSHGNALWGAGMMMTGVENGYDAQYRLQKTFTDRCNRLVRSSDAGAYFVAPEARLSGAELSRKTRAMIVKAHAGT